MLDHAPQENGTLDYCAENGIDKVGPFNYKGLLTPWEQPTEGFYWYRNTTNTRKQETWRTS